MIWNKQEGGNVSGRNCSHGVHNSQNARNRWRIIPFSCGKGCASLSIACFSRSILPSFFGPCFLVVATWQPVVCCEGREQAERASKPQPTIILSTVSTKRLNRKRDALGWYTATEYPRVIYNMKHGLNLPSRLAVIANDKHRAARGNLHINPHHLSLVTGRAVKRHPASSWSIEGHRLPSHSFLLLLGGLVFRNQPFLVCSIFYSDT